jgi:acetyl esterase/lipase
MGEVHHQRRQPAVRHGEPVIPRALRQRVGRAALPLLFALQAACPIAAQVTPAPAHGAVLSSSFLGVLSTTEIEHQAAGFFEMYPVPPMSYEVESWSIELSTQDFDGSPVTARAQLFVPRVDGAPGVRPAGENRLPLLVFGSGTTGISDACAPSLEQPEVRRWGWYTANMLSYAASGFIVIFPDYVGFNDPDRPQRYFSRQAEGHLMLDAARAALAFMTSGDHPARAAHIVFAAGYSQGGHAAFSAADLQSSYAPEVPLAGIVGFGATTDVTALLREGPVYAPFLLYAWSRMYGTGDVDPARVLQPKWASTLEADAARMCVDEFQAYYPADATKLYRTDFHQALNNNRVASILPGLATRLAENRAGLSGHRLPSLIVQGSEDIVVTTATQDRFVAALRAAGSPVRYLIFDGVRHRYSRPAGFVASVEWMLGIARGDPAPSDGRGT